MLLYGWVELPDWRRCSTKKEWTHAVSVNFLKIATIIHILIYQFKQRISPLCSWCMLVIYRKHAFKLRVCLQLQSIFIDVSLTCMQIDLGSIRVPRYAPVYLNISSALFVFEYWLTSCRWLKWSLGEAFSLSKSSKWEFCFCSGRGCVDLRSVAAPSVVSERRRRTCSPLVFLCELMADGLFVLGERAALIRDNSIKGIIKLSF